LRKRRGTLVVRLLILRSLPYKVPSTFETKIITRVRHPLHTLQKENKIKFYKFSYDDGIIIKFIILRLAF
jgi:hypothetical protein